LLVLGALVTFRNQLDHLIQERNYYARQIAQEEKTLLRVNEHITDVLTAQKLCQNVAEQVQANAHKQIASVVTRCLETIFGEEAYEFKIIFEQKRGKTEARLVFVRGELEVDPTSAAGGGVVDVTAFALRLACLILSRPKKRLFLAADEPFKMLSANYSEKVRELLITLSKELGLQIFMVTHQKALVCGKVVEL